MGADGDRDRQRLAALEGALREQPHIVGRDDIDAGEVLLLDDEAVDAGVDAELGIARDHHAGGDHRPAVVDRRHRDRQLEQIDVVADQHHLARRRGLDVFRRDRLGDRLLQLVLDLAIGLAAERHDGALARADDAGHHRHVVADHVMEIERGARLIDQRGDVADVHRLMQIDELAGLPQPVEELAEILLHQMSPKNDSSRSSVVGGRAAAAKLLRADLAEQFKRRTKGPYRERQNHESPGAAQARRARRADGGQRLSGARRPSTATWSSGCGRRRSTITTCSPCAACRASRCRCRWSSASTWRARSPRSGGGVSGWKPGDRVLVNPLNKKKGLMGEMLDGGMAEYCLRRRRPAGRACRTA